ncbi:hypothetical protein GIB67_018261 [Kingdonia uniflora]|uniref:Dilute domain-containing protein n=1 Tax=Kingdonia uniflora TaxID=39325 RepID=A0A7J7LES0_9MAGN|nr:hypothetical protein GIB67_018261 [Kingdonia uniflora]
MSLDRSVIPKFLDDINNINVDDSEPIGSSSQFFLHGIEYEQARIWIIKCPPSYDMRKSKHDDFLKRRKLSVGKGINYKISSEEEFIPWVKQHEAPGLVEARDYSRDEDGTPFKELQEKVPKVLDDFDSRMFEWTQRACSPEIYSSSMEIELSLANGHHDIEELKVNESHSVTPTNKHGPKSENMLRRFHIERQHESMDAHIKCVMQEIAFSQGKPVAAFTIYKCLLHWKSFDAERTSVFDRVIQMIGSAIEAPRTSRESGLRTSGRSFGANSPSSHWQSIIETLNNLLATLKQNFVPPVLVQKFCTQIFSYINVQLFNSLLLRRECCTFSNGEYVKAGLAELELWCVQAKEEVHLGMNLSTFGKLLGSWNVSQDFIEPYCAKLEALPAIRDTNQLGSNFKVFPIHFLNKDKRLR